MCTTKVRSQTDTSLVFPRSHPCNLFSFLYTVSSGCVSPMLQSQNIRSAGMHEFVLCTQGQTKERPACWEVPSFIIELSNCS